jgi:hypothetical protein
LAGWAYARWFRLRWIWGFEKLLSAQEALFGLLSNASAIFTKDGLLILAAVTLVAGLVGFIAGRSGAPEPASPAVSQVSTAVHGPSKGSGVAGAEEIVARAPAIGLAGQKAAADDFIQRVCLG